MTTNAAFADALSAAAPAVLREVAPPEAPWPGILVTDGDEVGVLVDADLVAASFPYWDDPDGHVAVPREILLSSGRVRALMPACPLSLASLLLRWERDPPALGELVTAAISVLRGAGQYRGDGITGSWWLRTDGRPLFVAGSGTATLPEASGAALRGMSAVAGTEDASSLLLQIAHALLGEASEDTRTAEWEGAVFALAPATAIVTAPRAEGGMPSRPVTPAPRAGRRAEHVRRAPPVRDRLADRVAAVIERARRRGRPRMRDGRGRRGALMLAAGAVVLVAGMLWPATGAPAPSSAPPAATPEAAAPEAPAPGDLETPDAADFPGESGVEIARGLLRDLDACVDDVCRAGFWENPDTGLGSELPDPDGSTIDLIDDLGGVLVLRVQPPGDAPTQILVIVEVENGRWRLRDVRPLAPLS